jgi:hypothetical protein
LMLGRAKPGEAEVKFETGKKLTRRFENVQRTQQEFWKRWIEEVFPERLKQSKWKQDKRDLKVRDVVLRKDETAAVQTYKFAKVVKVHTSADGKVRAADIEYKLPGESVFRMTTRPIHKLVLVVPVEEQATAVGQAEREDAEAEQPAPLAVMRPEPVQQEETRATEVAPPAAKEPDPIHQEESEVAEVGRGPHEAAPQPTQEKQGRPRAAVKYKKVISRKKARKQAQTIIVSVPKEEEAMVDVGVRPKKRGRPRKAPGMDPPDPRKGSVVDPGEGVCADPVNGGAILRKGGPDPQGGNKRASVEPGQGKREDVIRGYVEG